MEAAIAIWQVFHPMLQRKGIKNPAGVTIWRSREKEKRKERREWPPSNA